MNFNKHLFIFLILFFGFFGLANSASAVTEFKATVKPSGGDYTTLSGAENGLDYTGTCDLTSSSYLTVAYDGAVGDPTLITDAEAVTWDAGASTGNIIHVTTTSKSGADKFFINVTAGSLADDDVIDDGDGNTITVNGTPDTAQISIEIDGDWTGVTDTTAVVIDGWTTDPTHYIKIYTTAAARHDGKWNTAKYRLEVTISVSDWAALAIAEDHTIIEGLQIATVGTYGPNNSAVRPYNSTGVVIKQNIIRNLGTGSFVSGILTTGGDVFINNNIFYDFITGNCIWSGQDSGRYAYIYNNTVLNCRDGIGGSSVIRNTAKNNLLLNCSEYAFAPGAWRAGSNNNATNLSTLNYTVDGGGNNGDRVSQTFTFADEAGDDFHLLSTDAGARNYGVDLNPDTYLTVTDDIDGQARPDGAGTWDIGADETANNVYYSVGQNATNHSSGGNVSITSGVATFDTAQVATNLGVGDRLTAGGNIYYLASKTDTTHWNVVTKLGAVPVDLGSTAVTSIAHEFTTLSSAISLASNSGHINNTDLTAANVVLNLPCYYDSAADTTAVTIDGYTTGANNYIKIYTPNNTTTEANTSQRHSGKWNEGKYRLEESGYFGVLKISENYVKVDGVQIHATAVSGAAAPVDAYWLSSGDITISNSILKGEGGDCGANSNAGIFAGTGATFRIYNNIIYDINKNSGDGSRGTGVTIFIGTVYIYNNTIYNVMTGIRVASGVAIAKNNISYNNTDNYAGTFNAASTNNLSGPTQTDAPGSNPRNAATVTFVNEAGDDFHLASNDAGARNYGINLAGDSYLPFSADIDGQQRVDGTPPAGGWDIGADEATEAVIQFMRNINFGRNINIKP